VSATEQVVRCAVISPDEALRSLMTKDLSGTPFPVKREFADFSEPQAVSRFLRPAASILLVDSADVNKAIRIAAWLEDQPVSVELVAFGTDRSQDSALALMRAGIREYVRIPVQGTELVDALQRAKAHLIRKSAASATGDVFSFLPAKPGSGASTIASHVSLALSRCEAGTLAVDLDQYSGVLAFMLRVEHDKSVHDAIEGLSSMDDLTWQRLTARCGDLAILSSDLRFGRP